MSEIKRPVFLSGENPGMTLYIPGTDQPAAVVSYWTCTDSPWGVGRALVLWLDTKTNPLTALGQGCILTDNKDLAKILVQDLTQHFPEFRNVPVGKLTYADAHCGHTFDGADYRVVCRTADIKVEVQWSDMADRKQVIWPRFPAGEAVYDLTTVICPCRVGRIQIDGTAMAGEVQTARTADGVPSSSAFLAFAETWVGPLTKEEQT